VLLPPPGAQQLTIDQDFSWELYQAMAPEQRPVGAYYTVRKHRPNVGEIDIDFVLHGDSGHASGWATRARVGDPVALWGPRSTFGPPDDTQWMLLVADETGLPAVAGILEALPASAMARVFIEVDNELERQPLVSAANFQVTWLYRNGAEPGTSAEKLVEAVREMRWPAGNGYAWGGGESRSVTMVRRYVRHVREMPRERVSIIPYWRHSSHPDDVREED
jgi:NADPH-dependent ferric siderophore reductase